MRLLLVQSRPAKDTMIAQEMACIEGRLGARDVALIAHNGVTEDADVAWLDGVDGVIFGGSGEYSVHHPRSVRWVTPMRRLLDAIFDRELPCFAICFGHPCVDQMPPDR